jgi:hypothetical protein
MNMAISTVASSGPLRVVGFSAVELSADGFSVIDFVAVELSADGDSAAGIALALLSGPVTTVVMRLSMVVEISCYQEPSYPGTGDTWLNGWQCVKMAL